MREAGKLRDRYGRYSQKLRDNDRDAILDLYRSNGFRDVQVAATTLDDYRGHDDELGVRYEIEEGKQWTVSQLTIEGARRGRCRLSARHHPVEPKGRRLVRQVSQPTATRS